MTSQPAPGDTRRRRSLVRHDVSVAHPSLHDRSRRDFSMESRHRAGGTSSATQARSVDRQRALCWSAGNRRFPLNAKRPRQVESRLGLSARWLDSKEVTVENAVPATGGRVFGRSGTVARLRIPRSPQESKIRALRIKSRVRSRAPKRS
jgi:hypothetical protein